MYRLYSTSASFLVLAAVVLTACQSAPPADASYEGLASRVSTLEGQMKSAQPTLKKVEAIESHFKTLSLELGRISKTYDHPFDMNAPEIPVAEKPVVVKSAPAVVVAPVIEEKPVEESALKKVEPKKDVVKKAAIPVGELAVTAVRIGEQAKGITRIVLDTTKPAEIHYDLDNAEGLLVIDVPNSGWVATEAQALKKSPMIKSFRATHDDAGAHMVVELKRTAKVVATARLNPSGNSGNRVYVDVAPAE